MKPIINIILLLLTASIYCSAQSNDCVSTETQGYNMLLIGNSFFRPYAEKLNEMAIAAGFDNHNGHTVFRGGDNGRPINFWNDKESREHQEIKAVLDQGNVEIFGMTAGNEPEDRTEGHRAWIEYALQNNPDITIFIAIPQIDFPADWDQRAVEFGFETIQELYDFFVNDLVHKEMVDQLRVEFPSTKIFTIPTGRATLSLYEKNMNNELLDDISMFGPQETSIFTDEKGHQGDIVREAGGLVWLRSIYDVDLHDFDYDTGFNTDLYQVAEDIVNSHDPDYSLCFGQMDNDQSSPVVSCESTYSVIIEQDITYAEGLSSKGSGSSPSPISLILDVYMPNNNSDNRPVYMFIHGGGFRGGSRLQEAIVDQAHYFASRGWVFVSIDYRLAGDLGSPLTGMVPQEWEAVLSLISDPVAKEQFLAMYLAQRDAKAAMRWIVANAQKYNINKDFITVGGGSAGAITAVALGISNQEDFRDEISQTDDPTLATTHLDQKYEIRSIVDYWGGNAALEALEAIYSHNRFDSDDPPLFIAHGTNDPTVLFSEAEELVHLYDSTGAHVELNPFTGGHGAWGATINGKSLAELSFDFLIEQQNLKVGCGNDNDGDGFSDIQDCDDNNPNVNPDQTEIPYNGIDDDCNATTLDDDLDQDGFTLADDCDDNDSNINPNQTEVAYNGIDDDCNAATLDDDLDQDGFVREDDCDDNDPNINPNQSEVAYNGIDDDCNEATLDDDLDQDGFVREDDCDDNEPNINPDAEEIPNNGIDEDCDEMDLVTSVHELENNTITIFPSPATDIVNIDVESSLKYRVNLYDLRGKLIKTKLNTTQMVVSLMPRGIYLLEISDLKSGKKIVERIVVQR